MPAEGKDQWIFIICDLHSLPVKLLSLRHIPLQSQVGQEVREVQELRPCRPFHPFPLLPSGPGEEKYMVCCDRQPCLQTLWPARTSLPLQPCLPFHPHCSWPSWWPLCSLKFNMKMRRRTLVHRLFNGYRRSCYPLPAWPPHITSVPLGQHRRQAHHRLVNGVEMRDKILQWMMTWLLFYDGCKFVSPPAPPWFHCSHTGQSPLLPGQFSWASHNSRTGTSSITWLSLGPASPPAPGGPGSPGFPATPGGPRIDLPGGPYAYFITFFSKGKILGLILLQTKVHRFRQKLHYNKSHQMLGDIN